jgi:hypothetical protein
MFGHVNGKNTAVMIAYILALRASNVTNDLTYLNNKGLIYPINNSKPKIYAKIPELRDLRFSGHRLKLKNLSSLEESSTSAIESPRNGPKHKVIDTIVKIGTKYHIENIDPNWIDALVILNFIETACTKFLMDHGQSEDAVTVLKWEEKLNAVHNKLFEEAKKRGTKPRNAAIAVLKNYREQRNTVDHQAHVQSARLDKDEIRLLMNILRVFVNEVFDRHKEYCSYGK